mgnify:FL=1
MTAVYGQLGYDVEFIQVPTSRGIDLLKKGIVDGDIARITSNVASEESIIVIDPPYANVDISLVCTKGVPCHLGILKDKDTIILTGDRMYSSIKHMDIKAQILPNERGQLMIELMRVGRYNYAIYAITRDLKSQLANEFNITTIATPNINHVINRKHEHLAPKLEKILTQELLKRNLFKKIE